MARKTFGHIAVDSEIKKKVDDVRDKMENLGVDKPTYDETLSLLLEKDNMFTIPREEMRRIVAKLRGVK